MSRNIALFLDDFTLTLRITFLHFLDPFVKYLIAKEVHPFSFIVMWNYLLFGLMFCFDCGNKSVNQIDRIDSDFIWLLYIFSSGFTKNKRESIPTFHYFNFISLVSPEKNSLSDFHSARVNNFLIYLCGISIISVAVKVLTLIKLSSTMYHKN